MGLQVGLSYAWLRSVQSACWVSVIATSRVSQGFGRRLGLLVNLPSCDVQLVVDLSLAEGGMGQLDVTPLRFMLLAALHRLFTA